MSKRVCAVLWMWVALAACESSSNADMRDASAAAAPASDAGPEPMANTCETKAEECAAFQKSCEESATGPVCVNCPDGQFARAGGPCQEFRGDVTAHDFDAIDVAARFEMDGLCQSWTIGNEEEIFLNGLELSNDGGYHHSNWFFVPETEFKGEDGQWPCASRNFTEPRAALAGGVLYAQSTQSQREVQTFPKGVALRIPARAKIVGATHILNFRTESVMTQMRMKLYGLAAEDVTTELTFMRLNYGDLTIPPGVESEFYGDCDMEKAQGVPLDAEIYWLLPHYHRLGAGFRLERLGGPDDGEVLFEVGAFSGEAQGRMFDPPIQLSGAKGLRFACRYHNTTDTEVNYGIGDQEMCVMLGFVRSDFFYDALVDEGDRVEAGSEPRYTGKCNVIAFPPPARK